MARSKKELLGNKEFIRGLLGIDSTKWSRECPLPYRPHFERSIDLLHEAARSAVQGTLGVERAKELIFQMDDLEMREWFDKSAQNSGKVRLEMLGRSAAKHTTKPQIKRLTKKKEMQIVRDQGFHCRYCGIRIVPNDQLKKLQGLVSYEVLPNRNQKIFKSKNMDIHGIWLMTRATVDHITPLSSGQIDGNNDENLAASCWPCNYGKYIFTLEELGLDFPSSRPLKHPQWLGLTDLLF